MTNINSYVDGKFTQYSKVNVWLLSWSLNYGTSVIESIRVYKKNDSYYILSLDSYLERFEAWVKKNFKKEIINTTKIANILKVLLKLNYKINHPYFRLIYYIWDDNLNTLSDDHHFWIILRDLNIDQNSLHATYSELKRDCWNTHHLKLSSNYAKNISEIKNTKNLQSNYMIFLWDQWEILEWLSENIILQSDKGVIISPSGENILKWVNRNFLLSLFKKEWFIVEERNIFPNELTFGYSMLVCGSATGIRKIDSVDRLWLKSDIFLSLARKLFYDNIAPHNTSITKIL